MKASILGLTLSCKHCDEGRFISPEEYEAEVKVCVSPCFLCETKKEHENSSTPCNVPNLRPIALSTMGVNPRNRTENRAETMHNFWPVT